MKGFGTKEFQEFFALLEILGYREMKPEEITADIGAKNTASKKPQKRGSSGMMTHYKYERGKCTVELVTTYCRALGHARERARAFAVLKHSQSKAVLWSFQIRRVEGFFEKFYRWAKAFKDIADNWPHGPVYGGDMLLIRIPRVMHEAMFTGLMRNPATGKIERVMVHFLDIPISEDNRRFLHEAYERNAAYMRRNLERKPQRVLNAEKKKPRIPQS